MSDIIDRIRKLLALSKSDNVNEAASAAEKANELLLRHQLKKEAVLLPSIAEVEIVDPRLRWPWFFGLLTSCARNNYCDVVRIEESTGNPFYLRYVGVIFGEKENAEAARCLFLYLADVVVKLAGGNTTYSSWLDGASLAISEKLEKARIMFERENMSLLDRSHLLHQALHEYKISHFGRTHKPDMTTSDVASFEKGFNTADKKVSVPDRVKKKLSGG